jgi:hypothetical protein
MNRLYSVIFIIMCLGLAVAAKAENIWADHVVYNWDGTTATYTPGTGDNMTHGPFHSSVLWNNPLAILGKPNTLDRDDTASNGGNFREINMVWVAWYKGTNDYTLDGTPYTTGYNAGLTGNNGCGLKRTTVSGVTTVGQIVVEFDEPIVNNPCNPYGVDLIIHGNSSFATGIMIYENSNMDTYVLTAFGGGSLTGPNSPGAVFAEPVMISVAQSLDGPWFTFSTAPGDATVTADNYFPTQPYKWDSENHVWTSEELDWTKPVNPWIVNYFGNQTVADAIKLYAGSAGGTGLDLDWLTDDQGNAASLEWIKYVKFSDPDNNQGEICAVARTSPVKLGDLMSVTQEMIDLGLSELNFVDANDSFLRVHLWVTAISDPEKPVQIQAHLLTSLDNYVNSPTNFIVAYQVASQFILYSDASAETTVDMSLYVGNSYIGDGSDLAVLQWNGQSWDDLSITGYDSENKMISFAATLDANSAFVITQSSVLTPGDANGNGKVDVGDLGILAANYGRNLQAQGVPQAQWWGLGDFNGDGTVNVGDLGILAANYGSGGTDNASFASDYATAFGSTATNNKADDETSGIICSSLGLSLITLLVMGTLLIKLEE